MILKISLPDYVWKEIKEEGNYEEHHDTIEVILKAFFVPRIKEFVRQYKGGNVEWYREYYKFVLEPKPCIISDNFVTKVYELLEKEELFIEIKDLEHLFSYFILVSLAEYMEEFYGKEAGQTS